MKESRIFRNGLLGLSFVLMVVSLYLVFLYVPTEETMGIVQRIFYFHVPVAWVAFLAFFIVFLGSILYAYSVYSLSAIARMRSISFCTSAEGGSGW